MDDLADRRKLILAAAEKLLEHYGVSKTTVADIAREAAIGVGTVYLEFGSKNDIIKHIASARHAEILGRLRAAAEGEGSFSERLVALLDTRVETFVRYARCGTHAMDLVHCRCRPVEVSWDEYVRSEHALVEDLIHRAVTDGEFDVVDAGRTARAILKAYVSFAPPWVFREPPAEVREDLRALHRIILMGVARR